MPDNDIPEVPEEDEEAKDKGEDDLIEVVEPDEEQGTLALNKVNVCTQ